MKKLLKNKQEKGITLIALVVTIIVLLILAGISIAMLTGQNGILNRATEAKRVTGTAQTDEGVKIAVGGALADGLGTIKYEALNRELKERFEKDYDIDPKNDAKSWTVTIPSKSREYTVESNGKITIGSGSKEDSGTLVAMYNKALEDKCTNADGKCDKEDHLHIGDYVSYTNPTSGEYEVPANELGVNYAQKYKVEQNQLNWRVLGIEGEGESAQIKLIAGSPMKKSNSAGTATDEEDPYLHMYGAKAYLNSCTTVKGEVTTKGELDKICELYKTDLVTEARSVKMEDINEITGVKTSEDIKKYNLDARYGNKNYGESYEFANQWTPEKWIERSNSNNEEVGNVSSTIKIASLNKNFKIASTSPETVMSDFNISGTVDGYYYIINNAQNEENPYILNPRVYNMLCENVEFGSGRAYWLASPGVIAGSYSASFGPGLVGEYNVEVYAGTYYLFYSYGYEGENRFGVRPVVYLKSGVKKDQVTKITDKKEDKWNYGGSSGDDTPGSELID